jgi:plastocyanin
MLPEPSDAASPTAPMRRIDRGAMRITGSLVVCALAAAFTAATMIVDPDAPGRPAPIPASPGAPPEIVIADFAFGSITASPGAAVTVNNLDVAEHTVSAQDGSFDSGLVPPSATSSVFAPNAPGVYAFICEIHPSMEGQLNVAG